jgi:drug/metabolite transporter (DMT)-like permease
MGNATSSPRGALGPSLVLVFVTLCWGMSFTLMKDWHDNASDCPGGAPVAGLTMIALRMALALVILAVVRPQLFYRPNRRAHQAGFWVGLAFFSGFALQVSGLAMTTPARSGFITSLSSAFVPVGMWLAFRTRVAAWTAVGLIIGIAGAALLSVAGDDAAPVGVGLGDAITFVAAIFFTVQVILLDRLGRGVPPGHITVAFFVTCGVLALVSALALVMLDGSTPAALFQWIVAMMKKPHMPVKFGALTVISTVLAFGLMNAYQPQVPASRAALIYLLESVFSSLISVAAGFDQATWPLFLGGGLILAGNLLVELPSLRRRDSLAAPQAPLYLNGDTPSLDGPDPLGERGREHS